MRPHGSQDWTKDIVPTLVCFLFLFLQNSKSTVFVLLAPTLVGAKSPSPTERLTSHWGKSSPQYLPKIRRVIGTTQHLRNAGSIQLRFSVRQQAMQAGLASATRAPLGKASRNAVYFSCASLPCYSNALLTTQAQFAISARSSCAAAFKCPRNWNFYYTDGCFWTLSVFFVLFFNLKKIKN